MVGFESNFKYFLKKTYSCVFHFKKMEIYVSKTRGFIAIKFLAFKTYFKFVVNSQLFQTQYKIIKEISIIFSA